MQSQGRELGSLAGVKRTVWWWRPFKSGSSSRSWYSVLCARCTAVTMQRMEEEESVVTEEEEEGGEVEVVAAGKNVVAA